MTAPSTKMMVAVFDGLTVVKITGRANANAAVDFKLLMNGLRDRGHRRFALELSECQMMDSSFSGTLAMLGQKFANGDGCKPIHLISPNAKVIGLLESLGVENLFGVLTADALKPENFQAVEPTATTKADVTRTCLEAHELLCALNPANVAKFKDVNAYLAEDLKKLEGGGK
ncbi:MAG: STAS domain-containing protein [Verrucomicrobia bacterium]|nr:STAS domain-containing protein [Verrucomicrobiota bacterium]